MAGGIRGGALLGGPLIGFFDGSLIIDSVSGVSDLGSLTEFFGGLAGGFWLGGPDGGLLDGGWL